MAGIVVVYSISFFEKLHIDDPVGAVSVHGVCGVWGTLSVGLFAQDSGLFAGGGGQQLMVQLLGIVVGFGWAFSVSFGFFSLIKVTTGLRVSRREEIDSLDLLEHGVSAYPESFLSESHRAPQDR